MRAGSWSAPGRASRSSSAPSSGASGCSSPGPCATITAASSCLGRSCCWPAQARAGALAKRRRAGIRFELKKRLTTRLKDHLPFELTADQRRAVREISDDLTAPLRMHRLLMGDVGTGKTVVALFAMLVALE